MSQKQYKVLLVIPINRSYVVTPSLGLGYIAAVLRGAGHEPHILHCGKDAPTFKAFEAFIKTHSFDFIAFQMFTFDIEPVRQHLGIVKRHQPQAVNIAGGYHPSGDPKGILKTLTNLDFAFVSEVEIAFPAFLAEWRSGKTAYDNVPNLIWRRKNEIVINSTQLVTDLDTIPFPAWDLMDPRTYPEAPHGAFFNNFPLAPIIITRGCPMKCTFCAGKTITTSHIRKRSVDNVISEIKFLKEHYGVHEFMIEDENFTLHRKLLLEFCQTLIEQNINITWGCPSGVRLDTLNLEMLKQMESSGCHSLAIGVEFGSQRIHDITKKKLTLEKITEKVNLFKETNIKTTGFFMFGIPGETREEMLQTVRFAKSLKIDRAQFNNFMPLPGSKIHDELIEKGMGAIDHRNFFVHAVSYTPEGITKKELKNIQRKAYLEFYLRPKIMFQLLKEITSIKHFYRLLMRFKDAIS